MTVHSSEQDQTPSADHSADDSADKTQAHADQTSTAPDLNAVPASDPASPQPKSLWSAWADLSQGLQAQATEMLTGTTQAIGTVLEQTGQVVEGAIEGVIEGAIEGTSKTVETVVEGTGKLLETTQRTAGEALSATTKTVGETVTGAGQAIGSTIGTTIGSGSKVAESALKGTTKAIGTTLQQAQTTAQSAVQNTSQTVIQTWDKTTEFTQEQIQSLTANLDVKLLLPFIETVDLQAATRIVQELREKYPEDSNESLTHRLIQKKVAIVAGLGFASSIVPGASVVLGSLDFAALASLQAELGYQIAAVYGLDLEDSARQWEILAIFGAAMGTDFALTTGLKYALRNVPIAGGVVGASSNAMALYAVGYAACRFYESQGQALMSATAAQEALEAGESYLEEAQAQQLLVDQIIAHMVKASFPDLTWAEILPELEPYHLSPESLATIAANLDRPTPLPDLLQNLNPDYGLVALFACQGIANADRTITPPEEAILTALSTHLPLSYN